MSRFASARPGLALSVVALSLSGCTATPDTNTATSNFTMNTFGTSEAEAGATTEAEAEAGAESGDSSSESSSSTTTTDETEGEDTTAIPDFPPVQSGCVAVDLLFVIDNSASMGVYQDEMANAFPSFIDSLWSVLPPDVDVNIGITTTDFAGGCTTPESTANCQSTASATDIITHYNKPGDSTGNGVRGSQGRLYSFDGQLFYNENTSEDPEALKTWFQGAARSAGEDGCSFEMPVAAAGWAADPINTGTTGTNAGFFRDEGSLLVVFFLTDEPDKSPEYDLHVQRLLDVKSECGGAECIFMAGLVPTCILDVNQKLWQFMNAWGHDEEAPWANILETNMYPELVGTVLANVLADRCEEIPPIG